MPALLITIIVLMRVVQNIFSKQNSKYVPKNSVAFLKYFAFYIGCASIPGLISVIISLVNGTSVLFFGKTLLFASIAGTALAVSCLCAFYALSIGTMAINSLFAAAGLLVPTIAGMFLYGEYLTVWQYVGIVIFFFGAYFLAGNSKIVFGKFTFKTLMLFVLVLLMNGVTMLSQTMFAREVPKGNVSLFSLLMFFCAFVIFLGFLVIFSVLTHKNKGEAKENFNPEFVFVPTKNDDLKLKPKVFWGAIVLSIAVFIVNQVTTSLASSIDPAILFSITCGSDTIISAIVGTIIYKEKLTKETVLGIILGLGSLIMIKVFAV